MSQSTPFLVYGPVFDPTLFDIPFLDIILASPSTTIVAGLPTSIQHDDADLSLPSTSEDYQPSPPLAPIPAGPPPPPLAVPTIPPPPPTVPAVPPPPPHIYHPINTTIQHDIAATIKSLFLNRKKSHKCTRPNCPFITHSKATAFTHARKHLGDPKLYVCSCGARFACKDSAKRHCNTRNKVFECASCLKKFTRKDYRLVHQRKCSATPPT